MRAVVAGWALAVLSATGCSPGSSTPVDALGSDGAVDAPSVGSEGGIDAEGIGVDAGFDARTPPPEAGFDAGDSKPDAAPDATLDASPDASSDAGATTICGTNQRMCGGSCVDTAVDPLNCGACANNCPAGQLCSSGQCATTCGAPTTLCEPSGKPKFCADLATDARSCGTCGTVCASGLACTGGVCSVSCPGSEIVCGGLCIEPSSDRGHCGASPGCGLSGVGSSGVACMAGFVCANGGCSLSCPASQINCGGNCVDPSSDRGHCGATAGCGFAGVGSPGAACASGMACTNGGCSVSCPGGEINCDGACIAPSSDNRYCGATAGCGAPGSSTGVICAAGMVCTRGSCQTTCGANLVQCGGSCVDTANDPMHCGGCSTRCNIPNGSNVCAAGQCALLGCNAGFSRCPPVWTGMPVTSCSAFATDPANCGSCGRVCAATSATSVCTASACAISSCDAGHLDCDNDPSDGCETTGSTCPTPKRVFITSTTHSANMGGYAGADALCAAAAASASLTGTFFAWISDGSTTPASRFTQSTIPYALDNGTIVANNWQGLVSGNLRHAINRTESGGTPPSAGISGVCNAWTGTGPGGTALNGDCGRWSGSGVGCAGNSSLSNAAWTCQCSGGICGMTAGLFCIEQ